MESLLDDLVAANYILAHEGVLDVFGHISVRDPINPQKFHLSCSRSPGLVTRSDLMEFDLAGTVLAGDGHPYLERFIHSGIYSLRPDVQSVVHHHAGPVLPFAVTGKPLRPVFHLGSVAGLQSSLWDSQDDFGDTAMLITSHEMGLSLARSLGQGPTGLLKRHGAICVGTSIQQVTFIAVCMRDNADLLLKSLAIGEPDYLTEGEVEKAQKLHSGGRPVERAWEFWKSRVPSE
ncbi:MAG: class II aldolase/adducin family protein [Alphaproteobacteria bacterium]|nr:class II aldolase/adducin family protein [Alphaproteobacteria bacterium]